MKTIQKTKFAALVFAVAFFIVTLNLKAQWYGEIRHNFNNSTFANGRKCFSFSLGPPPAGYWGFIRSGYWQTSLPTAGNFEFSYINDQGVYGPGTFNGDYSIYDDAVSCSSPVKKNNCNGVFVVNAWNTGASEVFGLAGVYDEGVFFSTIDVTGNPVRTYRWDWPYTPPKMPRKPFMEISPVNHGVFYITGDFDNVSYVINVDASTSPATVNWAKFYSSGDSLTTRALMESPYSTKELVVVGSRYGKLANGSKGREAVFMTLDKNTGNVTGFNTYSFNSDGEDSWFTSIKQANSTFGGTNGYLIGGYCHSLRLQNNNYPQWMTKLSPNGNSVWSSIIEPIYATSYNQQTTWEINDVQERFNNASGQYENYGIAGSTINNGSLTYDYLSAFKLDQSGVPGALSPTEFRYSNTGGHGVFASCYLDLQDSNLPFPPTQVGLDMFAEDFTTSDHTWEHTYFNGVAGCTDSTTNIINVVKGPGIAQKPQVITNVFNANCPNMFSLKANFITDNLNYLCYQPTVPGGSNARLMATTGVKTENAEGSLISIYPNPSKSVVFIKSGNASQFDNATICILNNLGETVAVFNPDQIRDTNNDGLRVDFNKLNLSGGIYFITISGKQMKTTNYKVVYNKD